MAACVHSLFDKFVTINVLEAMQMPDGDVETNCCMFCILQTIDTIDTMAQTVSGCLYLCN